MTSPTPQPDRASRRRRRALPRAACVAAVALAVAGAAVVTARTRPADAWEPATTHAGLTEQAAFASVLEARLHNDFGMNDGLFTPLIIPPTAAPSLFAVLRKLNPIQGFVPDARGQLRALGWLTAGAVIADTPASHAADHFYDPLTHRGLDDRSLTGPLSDEVLALRARTVGATVVTGGIPAPTWVVDRRNPMNLAGFMAQYAEAVSGRTERARNRHLAGTLLAAGAILHVLEDMGSPSHVRDDLAAHMQRLGDDAADVGCRFERIASLAYGRLGVPAASGKLPLRRSLRDYFTDATGDGLADITSRHWFSADTLPRAVTVTLMMSRPEVAKKVASSLRRPQPAPGPHLDLRKAAQPGGARLTDRHGTCLAVYTLHKDRLSWSIPNRCALEQLAAILPQTVSYSAGALNWLLRGELSVAVRGRRVAITDAGVGLGAGRIDVYWDDARGVRTRYASAKVRGGRAGAVLAHVGRPPAGAHRVTALFRGVDDNSVQVVATGTTAYPPKR